MRRSSSPPREKVYGDGHANGRREFGEVIRDLLVERGYTTAIGNPDWAGFARELDGIGYETLRKAVTRERPPSTKVMESVATRLEVEPTIFWEYELARAKQAFDVRQVGDDEAFANLQKWLGR
jgi:hypothetical protein